MVFFLMIKASLSRYCVVVCEILSITPALIPSTHSLAAAFAGMLASNLARQQSWQEM